MAPRATVSCPDCDLTETFEKLQTARERIETHRLETGHDPEWELGQFADGVERAGNEAGVCGRLDLDDQTGAGNPLNPSSENAE